MQLAKGAFDVRLHPRVIGLSQDVFSWVVLKQLTQNLKLIPIIVRETPGSIIIRIEPVDP